MATLKLQQLLANHLH